VGVMFFNGFKYLCNKVGALGWSLGGIFRTFRLFCQMKTRAYETKWVFGWSLGRKLFI